MNETLAVRAGHVFDGERFIEGGALVLVASGRIVSIEPHDSAVPTGWPLVEHPGATLLPGLVDTHVHLSADSKHGALDRLADYSDAELDTVIESSLRDQLAAGVTTVRDLGDRRYASLDWRDRPGLPAVVAAGPPITTPGGHCWNMGGEAQGAAQLRKAVAERVERGVDVVKIMASGGHNTPGTNPLCPQYTLDELRLVVDEAHAAGLPVTAHAHALTAVEQAVMAGVDGIEHCTCSTPEGFRFPADLLDAIATRGISVCPTLGLARDASLPIPQSIRERLARGAMLPDQHRERAARLHQHGVRIVSGSDGGIHAYKPHGLLPISIVELTEAGIGLDAALASATSVAAEACGLVKKGRIQPGYSADLLLVDGDPASDPAALTRPVAVVLAGHVVGATARLTH